MRGSNISFPLHHSGSCGRSTLARRRPLSFHVRLRSEEHTSELQSRQYLVCRLLLEKKKKKKVKIKGRKLVQKLMICITSGWCGRSAKLCRTWIRSQYADDDNMDQSCIEQTLSVPDT